MYDSISPKYKMILIDKIHDEMWNLFESSKKVEFYIEEWIEYNYNDFPFDGKEPNFKIQKNSVDNIDLLGTLNKIDNEILMKIAIDLEIETPDFIPAVPTFKNIIKSDYVNANRAFQKAFKEIEKDPDMAIGLSNTTLESIIKEILKDDLFNKKLNDFNKKTLYKLSEQILKEFSLVSIENIPKEIRNIGSSMLKISQNIEELRSDKSNFHGKTKGDIIIDEPMYAYFIINSVTTIGLFLISFYNKLKSNYEKIEEIPF